MALLSALSGPGSPYTCASQPFQRATSPPPVARPMQCTSLLGLHPRISFSCCATKDNAYSMHMWAPLTGLCCLLPRLKAKRHQRSLHSSIMTTSHSEEHPKLGKRAQSAGRILSDPLINLRFIIIFSWPGCEMTNWCPVQGATAGKLIYCELVSNGGIVRNP